MRNVSLLVEKASYIYSFERSFKHCAHCKSNRITPYEHAPVKSILKKASEEFVEAYPSQVTKDISSKISVLPSAICYLLKRMAKVTARYTPLNCFNTHYVDFKQQSPKVLPLNSEAYDNDNALALKKYLLDRCFSSEFDCDNNELPSVLSVDGSSAMLHVVHTQESLVLYISKIASKIRSLDSFIESQLKFMGYQKDYRKHQLLRCIVNDISRDINILDELYEAENEALNLAIARHCDFKSRKKDLKVQNSERVQYDIINLYRAAQADRRSDVTHYIQFPECLSKDEIGRYNLRLIILNKILKYVQKDFIKYIRCNSEGKNYKFKVKKSYRRALMVVVKYFNISDAYIHNSSTNMPNINKAKGPLKEIQKKKVNDYYLEIYNNVQNLKCSHDRKVHISDPEKHIMYFLKV